MLNVYILGYCFVQGRLSPHNTLEQVPPSASPEVPSHSPSPPFPFLPLPSLFLSLEVAPPLIAARGSGERFSSPSGSGRSPAAKRYLVNFRLKISFLVATIFKSFSGNETSNDRHVGCLLVAFLQKLRGKCISN